jgi:transcriptional regulator with PAS, ATPase and Fis domain
MIKKKKIREDLFYRINTFTITIPPLRFRREDIPLIAEYILDTISKKMDLSDIKFSEKFIEKIKKYNWPGNVRELQGVIERELLHLEEKSKIIKHIPDSILRGKLSKDSNMKLMSIAQMEKKLIKKTISTLGDNNKVVSESLGVSQSTLYRKMREYNL